MSMLEYRSDWAAARQRLTVWWNGGDIGRPALAIGVKRDVPRAGIPAMPEPAGWVTHYSTRNEAYRINCGVRACLEHDYFGEAVPANSAGDLAPNCLALFLGCHGVEMPGTVWCEPCIAGPETARFEYDPDNFYWNFCLRVTRSVVARTRGKLLQQFPDLIEGLDTLEAMRGGQTLLVDLLDRHEWVHACLRRITDRYFHHYDVLYDLIRDDVGGSVFWAWAPGRMAKFQCDFSAMISKDMFGEFMMPVLREMTARVSYCMYHWDGPGAIQHHDHLLSLPRLNMLQWTPGAGAEPTWDRRWWPLYHKTLDAGKKLLIGADFADTLRTLKKEFGAQFKGMYIGMGAASVAEAAELLRVAEC